VEIYGLTTLPEITKPHVDKMLEILEWNREEMRKLKKIKPEFDCRFDYKIID